MVKVLGPMFSFEASGTIGSIATFSKWKGRPYVRQRVIPSNPKSALQVSTRAMMRFLSQAWVDVGATPQASWDALAAAAQISAFNAYISRNQQRYREFQAPSQTYPAAETGTLPVATLDSAVGGPSYMDLTMTITTLNAAWGVMLFRSATGTFTPSRGNCIAVLPVNGTGTLVYTDSNLAAGVWYYDAKFFTAEGSLGPDEGEVNGTAT
jgi:hypothetical protein